jgi:cytidylate kinase
VHERHADASARPLVVAIDGPSGSGKSTVARGVARALGIGYLDTGAMYRAVTWLALARGVPLNDTAALTDLAEHADLALSPDPDEYLVTIDGHDVTTAIRGDDVTGAVSRVSAVPGVRSALVRRQREVLAAGPVAVEGRDIGTTVAPDAPVKVFLTADPVARAERRGREVAGEAADHTVLSATEESLRRRDEADSGRATSPLAQAADAVVIDSTDLTADEVVARVLAEVAAVAES